MFEPHLEPEPQCVPRTLRLIRVYDVVRGIITSHEPLYLASHWRIGRSYPCIKHVVGVCPWCKGLPRREHAYIGVTTSTKAGQLFRAIMELPPDALAAAMRDVETGDLYALGFDASRRHAKAPLKIDLHDGPDRVAAVGVTTTSTDILRTLAKVYGLPDPWTFTTEEDWKHQVYLRTNDPEYSPSVRPNLED
jgi:hypothetical protein